MYNQNRKLVAGITPLFLAAQAGNMDVVKLLVQSGANPTQPSYIQGKADLCTPAQA
ncbi:ANK_REP_REGION domain-containing protein, partial [Haematococcus lacustris]